MEAIDALKQKVLSLAIQGKLVPQDPNDEPASVLLEKIKAEKAELVKQGKIKKDKQESYIFRGDDNKYYEKVGDIVRDITEEIPFEIPESWTWCRLSELGKLNGGKTPKQSDISDRGVIPYYKVSDMNQVGNELYMNIANSYLINPSNYPIFPRNSIIFPKNGGAVFTNKKRILLNDALVDLNTGVFTPYEAIFFNYIFMVFKLIDFREMYKGTALPTINSETLKKILISVPPLSEQKRIVSEIESIFKRIDEVKSNQEELARLKDGLKNKILDLAIQGKLVEQDPNDEPASVLLEKIKAEKAELVKQGKIKKDKQESYIYKGADNRHYEKIGSETKDITEEIPFEIPESWEWCRLGNVINYGETKAVTYLECDKNQWILDLEDIEKDTSRILCKNRIKDKPFKSTKKTFIKGDVLYSKLRPYLNKVVVADEDGVCTSEILPFRIYYGIVPEYLQCCLKSHYFYEYVNQLTYGVKMPRLGTEDGKRGLIPLPPIQEQCRIIRTFSKMLEFTNQL